MAGHNIKATTKPSIVPPMISKIPDDAKQPILERYVKFFFGRNANEKHTKTKQTPILEAANNGDILSVIILVEIFPIVFFTKEMTLPLSSPDASSDSSDSHDDVQSDGHSNNNNIVDINAKDKYGSSALCIALSKEYWDIAKILIDDGGASIHTQNSWGATPLHLVCQNGNTKEFVNLLIDNDADIDATTWDDCTPLHEACKSGHVDIAKILIDEGANVDYTTSNGQTPLHLSCQCRHEEYPSIVKLLIEEGADVEVMDNQGRTPLGIACLYGHVQSATYLISIGRANTNHKDFDCRTPLQIVCMESCITNRAEVVNLLVEKGTNILNFPLYEIFNGCAPPDAEMIRILVENGASIDDTDCGKRTLLHLACDIGIDSMIETMITLGADINAITERGNTPLHFVCGCSEHLRDIYWCPPEDFPTDWAAAAKVLIDHGADTNNVTNDEGKTPFDCACSWYEPNAPLIELLASQSTNRNRRPADMAIKHCTD